ncbi:MAG: hypothetical protein E7329_05245 [Clostridiales bacterium]|nr:hypothetical protein [Clostridiales bacterium]
MKKFVAVLLTMVLMLCAANALAAGKLIVTQENYHTVSSLWTYGHAYVKVENTGDKPIKVNAGVLEIYDENGDVITSTDWLSAYARILQPGEYTYASLQAEIEDGSNVPVDYAITITGKSDQAVTTMRLPCTASLELDVEEDWWTYNYMYAEVTNHTDAPLYDISVVLALLDAEGNILYMDDDSLYSEKALAPGSTLFFRKDISSEFMDYFAANNLVPASVDAIAYVEIENE